MHSPGATSGRRSFALNDVHRPGDLVLGRRVVGAEGAGAYRAVEVAAERRIAILDPLDRPADRPRGVHAGALGRRADGPVAAAEAHGARELAADQLTLLAGARRALHVPPALGLVDIVLELRQPLAVGALGLLVEPRPARVRVGAQLRHGGADPPGVGLGALEQLPGPTAVAGTFPGQQQRGLVERRPREPDRSPDCRVTGDRAAQVLRCVLV